MDCRWYNPGMKRAFCWPWLLIAAAVFGPAWSQEPPSGGLLPDFEEALREMRFEAPTRIAGRVLYLDTYDPAVWIEWEKIFAHGSWHSVPEGRQFILYPRDDDMMALFKSLPRGSELRVLVQRGNDGKVRVLSLDEL